MHGALKALQEVAAWLPLSEGRYGMIVIGHRQAMVLFQNRSVAMTKGQG